MIKKLTNWNYILHCIQKTWLLMWHEIRKLLYLLPYWVWLIELIYRKLFCFFIFVRSFYKMSSYLKEECCFTKGNAQTRQYGIYERKSFPTPSICKVSDIDILYSLIIAVFDTISWTQSHSLFGFDNLRNDIITWGWKHVRINMLICRKNFVRLDISI